MMKMRLFHGRDDVRQGMEDWGFEGPTIVNIKWVKYTYGGLYLGFDNDTDSDAAQALTGWSYFDDHILEISYSQKPYDLVVANGKFYADFEIDEGV